MVVWIEVDDSTPLPDDQARTMQHAGACCVDTSADDAEIEQAIVCATTGKAFLSHRLMLRRSLTPREQEVLGYLAAGWTTAQIARALLITPSTVSSHMARICRKLGLASRAEAAEAGHDLGLGCDLAAATNLGAYYAAKRLADKEFYQARRASGL
jgi:DNA-binding NarL/FixJ family response regulator